MMLTGALKRHCERRHGRLEHYSSRVLGGGHVGNAAACNHIDFAIIRLIESFDGNAFVVRLGSTSNLLLVHRVEDAEH